MARFQLAELDKVTPRPGEDEERPEKVLASAERVQRLCEKATICSMRARRPFSLVSAPCGAAWSILRRSDPVFQPYLDARDGIKGPARRPGAAPAALFRLARNVSRLDSRRSKTDWLCSSA